MRIGIMLRHMDQHGGGVLVYTRSLLPQLFELGSGHEFVLIYQSPRFLGTYAEYGVEETVVGTRSRLLWDQLGVPNQARKSNLDLIFNPKYSLPLITGCRTVFVNHGMDWYVNPGWSRPADRLNHRLLIPRYAAKADRIIAVSDTAREHMIEFLGVEEERVQTVYLGINPAFHQSLDDERLARMRREYELPERFFLYCGQIYPPKNFGRLIRAYAEVGPRLGIHLVVAGTHTWMCEDEIGLIDELGIESWVTRPGWIDHEALPGFYQMAVALLLPSLYEACPAPPLEAMASNCPVLTSNRHGTQEIAGDAALLVNPERVDEMAGGMERIATDERLRSSLVERGRRRVAEFTWDRCARETLGVLESAG